MLVVFDAELEQQPLLNVIQFHNVRRPSVSWFLFVDWGSHTLLVRLASWTCHDKSFEKRQREKPSLMPTRPLCMHPHIIHQHSHHLIGNHAEQETDWKVTARSLQASLEEGRALLNADTTALNISPPEEAH